MAKIKHNNFIDTVDEVLSGAKEEGIFAGMSSGGSVATAIKIANQLESGVVVAIICDRGDRYLSSDLFD